VPPAGTVTLVCKAESSGDCCDDGDVDDEAVVPAQPVIHVSNKKPQTIATQPRIRGCRGART
jgi:hypothetical protein